MIDVAEADKTNATAKTASKTQWTGDPTVQFTANSGSPTKNFRALRNKLKDQLHLGRSQLQEKATI